MGSATGGGKETLPMKTATTVTLALAGFLVGGTALAADWEIDPAHTTAQFSVKHMMITTVRGTFDKVAGNVTLDDKDPTKSNVELTIDASTINTHEPKRDAHLKSPDFFDVAKTPNITFKSTKIDKAGKGKFKVTGDLTMRGVTKPVVLNVEGPTPEVKNPMGKLVRGVVATGKINRKDWGLNWNKALEAGGVLVSDEVQLQVDAELVQKPGAEPAVAKEVKAEAKKSK
jgi:polyisoprenoid-binding protein YceI